MKKNVKLIVVLAVTAQVLAGCGSAGNAEETSGTARTPAAETETAVQEEMAADLANYSYLEEIQMSDFFSNGKKYSLCVPKGGEYEDGFYYYWEHGVNFTAKIYNGDDSKTAEEDLQAQLRERVDKETKDWKELYKYSDVGVGEILEKGDDRYLFMTATDKDIFDTSYRRKRLVYMSVRDGGAAVFWNMEVSEIDQDKETTPLIQEVASFYGLNLDELVMEDGLWADQSGKSVMSDEDLYYPKEGDIVLEKVEGYEYLGMTEMAFAADDENFTCPVLVPMGRDTMVFESSATAAMHGVNVRITADYTGVSQNYQRLAQEQADKDIKNISDSEVRNVRVVEMTPMKGQEAGVYYAVEYEAKGRNDDQYYKMANLQFFIQVKDCYFLCGKIYLSSNLYDGNTNDLIKELETAYGLDLSEWYAQENVQ